MLLPCHLCSYYVTTKPTLDSEMAPKKKPQPLHRSLQLIQEERANVAKRTQQRIAQLFAEEENAVIYNENPHDKVGHVLHCYLNTFCFCVWLGIMNLLFLQWVYMKVNVN
jgi:hypothetical protein